MGAQRGRGEAVRSGGAMTPHDIAEWVRGLLAAVIQGGATAVTGAVALSTGDPYYQLGSAASWAIMWKLFAVSGLLGGMAYLRQKPMPEHKEPTK